MIWILLLLFAGCVDQNPDLLAANQTINQYISFLENHSKDNYTLSWNTLYIKDGKIEVNATTIVYNNKLIIQNFTHYAFWNYKNKTCYRVFDRVGCEDGGFSLIANDYFWTKQYIEKEKRALHTLLKIASVKANQTHIIFQYNYSNVSYADLSALSVNPSVVNKVSNIVLEYEFDKNGMVKHIKKTLYLTNNSTYYLEIIYGNLSIFSTVPSIKNNTEVDYVKLALSYVITPPENKKLRAAAIEYKMPFLCKLDKYPTVCIDAYITKTNDIEACQYAPNPAQCYGEYNATARS